MGFVDKLRLVAFKLLTTELWDHQISVQETPLPPAPVRSQKENKINLLVRLAPTDTFHAAVCFTPARVFILSFPSPSLFR